MKILCVIVLYKCKLENSKSYRSLLQDKDITIFAYDNSPTPQDVNIKNVIYVHDSRNSGLGVAYNKAAQYAKCEHIEWLLLLDQDTFFPYNALLKYIKAIEENPSILLFAPKHKISNGKFLSPTPYYHKTSKLQDNVPTGIVKLLPYAPINSGMLINVDLFWKAGGYDEAVWLDFSDIRFIEKVRTLIDAFYVIDTVCIQDFSVDETDVTKLKNRFRIFCQCAKACKRERFWDNVDYLYVTAKRCLSLVVKNKNLSFISIYLKTYF